MKQSNYSYWELKTYFDSIDFTIIGSGIVGLSTAHFLRKKHPKAKILILEKGILPEGASTKNAGFACFGSLSEILSNLKTQPKEDVYRLIEKRYKGLQKLRALLGDKEMGYLPDGGFEIFPNNNPSLLEECLANMEEINNWLFPIFGEEVYAVHENNFGFAQTIGIIKTSFEGNIHTGNTMKTFVRKTIESDVPILNNVEVSTISEVKNGVEITLKDNFSFSSKKVFLCTNAFTKKLFDLDVLPARGQVLITKPIENLPFKGNFHLEEGFYYFRNVGNRVLFGGGRNLDIAGETTSEFGTTKQIQERLESYLREIILPNNKFEVEHRWSGIMAMGNEKLPIVKQLSENIYCGVRLSGMGVALGIEVGEELASFEF